MPKIITTRKIARNRARAEQTEASAFSAVTTIDERTPPGDMPRSSFARRY